MTARCARTSSRWMSTGFQHRALYAVGVFQLFQFQFDFWDTLIFKILFINSYNYLIINKLYIIIRIIRGVDTPRKRTETTETETLGKVKFHLKSRKSMSYNVLAALIRRCPCLQKSQNSANYSSHRPQKTCENRLFRCFHYPWSACEWFGISVPRPQ